MKKIVIAAVLALLLLAAPPASAAPSAPATASVQNSVDDGGCSWLEPLLDLLRRPFSSWMAGSTAPGEDAPTDDGVVVEGPEDDSAETETGADGGETGMGWDPTG